MSKLIKQLLSAVGLAKVELPDFVLVEIQRVFPTPQIESVRWRKSRRRRWREQYDVKVVDDGRQVELEIEVDIENQNVYEMEVNYVAGGSNRRIEQETSIAAEEIPAPAMQRAAEYIALLADGFVPTRCEEGTNSGQAAYRIRGEAGIWAVKIKLLQGGEILEMQKKRRSR